MIATVANCSDARSGEELRCATPKISEDKTKPMFRPKSNSSLGMMSPRNKNSSLNATKIKMKANSKNRVPMFRQSESKKIAAIGINVVIEIQGAPQPSSTRGPTWRNLNANAKLLNSKTLDIVPSLSSPSPFLKAQSKPVIANKITSGISWLREVVDDSFGCWCMGRFRKCPKARKIKSQ